MNLYKKFVKETGLKEDYIKWLEKAVEGTNDTAVLIPVKENVGIPKRPTDANYETAIEYDDPQLSYRTEIWFPRHLTISEMEMVESIINYWSAIPYVSYEGNYGIEWHRTNGMNNALISIDFTKSSSDDYMAREILEKLALWIENGTPVKKNGTQKHKGVIKPVKISADCP